MIFSHYTKLLLAGGVASAVAQQGYGSTNDTTPGGNESLANAPYKNPNLPVEDRITDLLSRMTIEEKTTQLMQGDISNWLNTTDGTFNRTGLELSFAQKTGSYYVGYPISWEWLADNIKRGQDYAVNETRLGIPAIVQTEGIHGFLIGNATIFNSPLAHGCSFNRSLIERMAKQIAVEAKALGVTQLFAPVADLARELRFGRVEETYGEDPYLAGQFALHYVLGLQSLNVSAMIKHFAASAMPEQGLNTGPMHIGERELRSTWLPPFKPAIVEGKAWSIMSSYVSIDGVPQVADAHTVTEILRDEWEYDFYVMSDAGATDRLASPFRICPAPLNKYDQDVNEGNVCVTLNALPAGTDVEMGGGSFNYRSIPQLVEDGRLDISVVDQAVSRQLRVKFTMGLFENPFPAAPESEWESLINTPEAKELAREMDRESIVLLKNDEEILPISKGAKVAVIGPMADGFMNYGDYVVKDSQYRGVTPLAGIRDAVGNGTVSYAQGCERWAGYNDRSGFPEAIAAAEEADVAVVVVGTWSRDQYELWRGVNATTGEHIDLSDLSLIGAMGPLVHAIVNTTTPTVIVFSSGKPITEDWISNTTASLVQQFYPGEEGGSALADILFGDYNPSGKLSVSFPHDVGTLPVYYDYVNSGRTSYPGDILESGEIVFGSNYVTNTPQPWFPFGYGLSYTTFDYSNITLSAYNASATDKLTASVSVTNNGTRDGAEVVQLYVKDMVASVDTANIRLKGFEKVFIPAGETVDVEIPLDVGELGVWNRKMEYEVEAGDFTVYAGASSLDLRSNATLTVA